MGQAGGASLTRDIAHRPSLNNHTVDLLPRRHQIGLLGQHHQRVGTGQVADQMGPVPAGQLHQPVAVVVVGDDAAGELAAAEVELIACVARALTGARV